jgi:ABC-type anion transport system duplicated permease subunit
MSIDGYACINQVDCFCWQVVWESTRDVLISKLVTCIRFDVVGIVDDQPMSLSGVSRKVDLACGS